MNCECEREGERKRGANIQINVYYIQVHLASEKPKRPECAYDFLEYQTLEPPSLSQFLCTMKLFVLVVAVLKAVFMDLFPLDAIAISLHMCHMEFPERTVVLLSLKSYES